MSFELIKMKRCVYEKADRPYYEMQNELAIKITLSMHSKFVAAVFRLLQHWAITAVASENYLVFY